MRSFFVFGMKPLHFAPLQGYTQHAYRSIHAKNAGGVSHYYTPFIRFEKGTVRRKDLTDICPENNTGLSLIPQIIAGNVEDFDYLCDVVQDMGYSRIDLNMGCPAPMQTKLNRGSALVAHPDIVEAIAARIEQRTDVSFSVKMRLGWKEPDEWKEVLPILHGLPLSHITLHPRVGIQQYKGEVDMNSFQEFYEASKHPLVYNGDLKTWEDIIHVENTYPRLAGIMMGRGLLANPVLSAEYASGERWPWHRRIDVIMKMHDEWLAFCRDKYVSDAQVLLQIKTFWEYQKEWLDKKVYKKVMKSGSFRNYMEAVRMIYALKSE